MITPSLAPRIRVSPQGLFLGAVVGRRGRTCAPNGVHFTAQPAGPLASAIVALRCTPPSVSQLIVTRSPGW